MFARDANGDWAVPRRIVTDPATVAAQEVQDTLNLWEGEWFMDKSKGFPWRSRVLSGKNPDITTVRQLLEDSILSVTNVASIIALQVILNRKLRSLAWAFAGLLDSGVQITASSVSPGQN